MEPSFSRELWESAQDIWQGYHTHPFVRGLGDGTLPLDKFRYFMIQDYLYLFEYAKLFALGVAKSRDRQRMQMFAGMVYSTLNGEMGIHRSYMRRLGITEEELSATPAALANVSYTNYMLSVGYAGDDLDILVAVLACAWSYQEIAQELVRQNPQAAEHPLYGEWVQGYTSPEYGRTVEENIAGVDALAEGISPERKAYLREVFRCCSRYEAGFWDMAYEQAL